MRWIAILFLGAGSALLAEPLSLAAQDQLVRPPRVSLAASPEPAGPEPAGPEPAGPEPASGRAAALEREFARYEADGEDDARILHGARIIHGARLPNEADARKDAEFPNDAGVSNEAARPAETDIPMEMGTPRETHAAAFDSLAVPLKKSESGSERRSAGEGWFAGPVAKITGGLAVTLGLFAIVVVLARRGGGINLRGLPREAFEVVGQTAIGPRQRLMVVRVGTQALVIGTSPAGIHRVAQIEDPDEAGQLIAQCRGMGSQAAFKSTLYELEQQRVAPGFVDDPPPPKSSNLFLRA